VHGIWKLNQTKEKGGVYNDTSNEEIGLVDFNGTGKYSDPEFVWERPVGPTALIFLSSEKLGKEYKNDIFVGSVKIGTIYHLDLRENRISLHFTGDLAVSVMYKEDDPTQILFGVNFGIITDLEVGPDGYLYVVSGNRGTDAGAIYRIVPD
jgi:glucose/arabinose dehydrogenase